MIKRFFIKAGVCVLSIVLALTLCVCLLFGNFIKGACSVTKLSENLYCMEYSGDDGFQKYLDTGGADNAADLSAYVTRFLSRGFYRKGIPGVRKQDFGCATLNITTHDGQKMTGRNCDNPPSVSMIYKVRPKDGFSYISTFDVSMFGFGQDWKPEGFANQYISLAGLFVAMDGVNEKGLAIADLNAGVGEETHQNGGKPDLTTTAAIKYLLKTASDVNEAVSLLGTIDMHSDIGCLHHLSISDAQGTSVVVEWVDDRMVVTETPAVTNHYLCPEKYGYSLQEGDCRYETLMTAHDSANGTMTSEQLLDTVESIFQNRTTSDGTVYFSTQWTVLFNLTNPSADYYWQQDTGTAYHIDL